METSESEPNPIRPFDRCFHASIQCKDLPALCAALVAPDVDVNKLYRKKTPLILAIQVVTVSRNVYQFSFNFQLE
jgi:hypothetical protein